MSFRTRRSERWCHCLASSRIIWYGLLKIAVLLISLLAMDRGGRKIDMDVAVAVISKYTDFLKLFKVYSISITRLAVLNGVDVIC